MKKILVFILNVLSIALGLGVVALIAIYTQLSFIPAIIIALLVSFICLTIVRNTAGLSSEELSSASTHEDPDVERRHREWAQRASRRSDDRMIRGIYNNLDSDSRRTLRDLGNKY